MSQGSGSPVTFLDAETCDDILRDIRGADGKLPEFGSVESDPGSPRLALEPEVACDRATQTSPTLTHEQPVQALPPQLVVEGSTQTLPPWTRDNVTQVPPVLTRDGGTSMPPVHTDDKRTATPPTSTTTRWTQMPKKILKDGSTGMPAVQSSSVRTQAGTFFDNEIIPPGAPRPKLPWAYTYAQFDQLLAAYPEVHPEDFVIFGILQEQPRRGSCREWGEVARSPRPHDRRAPVTDKRARRYRKSNSTPGPGCLLRGIGVEAYAMSDKY